jgi:hypothetical protein
MTKKKGNFIEENIEKAVLGVVILLCVYFLFAYVLRSPYVFPYSGRNLNAGQIDLQINDEARELKKLLDSDAAAKSVYEPNVGRFIAKMSSTVETDTNVLWPLPSAVEMKINKRYRIPEIGEVKSASAEHIRAAAYVPNREITSENANLEESYEPNDLDLVTVQASFDVGALADAFETCFAGKDLPDTWRDKLLAKPVFASVDLQRQQKEADGKWGQWEDVPRAKIDPHRDDFRVIEDVNDLPSSSITVRILRLGEPSVQASLLQPEPYQIASSEEEWYPPLLHKKYLMNKRDKEAQERREHTAAEREQQDQERERSRTGREERRPKPAAIPGGRGGAAGEDAYLRMMLGVDAGGGPSTRGTTTRPRSERRMEQPAQVEQAKRVIKPDVEAEIYEEMRKILLSDKDVSKLREPIVFWAHDDTVQPGSTYRYRVRLGVFNPIAGTGQVREEDGTYENRAILWSKFSDVTEPMEIPQRIYFFPVGVQEAAKQVEVLVSKYDLGYWYSQQFIVKRGDVIGKEVTVAKTDKDKNKGFLTFPAQGATDKGKSKGLEDEKNLTLPEVVDYTTDAVVVDVVAVSDWAGDKNLIQRQYYDMLFSYDGTTIDRLATRMMLWPEELRARYVEIKAMEKRPKLALHAWSNMPVLGGSRMFRGLPSRMPATRGGEEQMTQEEMMYMMMLQGTPQK